MGKPEDFIVNSLLLHLSIQLWVGTILKNISLPPSLPLISFEPVSVLFQDKTVN